MKKIVFFLSFLTIASFTFAQKPAASPRATAESKMVKVSYGQPSKKGRVMFGVVELTKLPKLLLQKM
jgi:hypothetical protein